MSPGLEIAQQASKLGGDPAPRRFALIGRINLAKMTSTCSSLSDIPFHIDKQQTPFVQRLCGSSSGSSIDVIPLELVQSFYDSSTRTITTSATTYQQTLGNAAASSSTVAPNKDLRVPADVFALLSALPSNWKSTSKTTKAAQTLAVSDRKLDDSGSARISEDLAYLLLPFLA